MSEYPRMKTKQIKIGLKPKQLMNAVNEWEPKNENITEQNRFQAITHKKMSFQFSNFPSF